MPYDAFAAGLGDHRIVTTLCPGGKERMRRLIAMVQSGRFDPLPLITHRVRARRHRRGLRPLQRPARRRAQGGHPPVGAARSGRSGNGLTWLPLPCPPWSRRRVTGWRSDHPDGDPAQSEPLDRLQSLAQERDGDEDRDGRPERRGQPDQPRRGRPRSRTRTPPGPTTSSMPARITSRHDPARRDDDRGHGPVAVAPRARRAASQTTIPTTTRPSVALTTRETSRTWSQSA